MSWPRRSASSTSAGRAANSPAPTQEGALATIYFDLDGTLVDCRERHYRLYADSCARLGLPALPNRRYWTLRRQGASSPSLAGDASDPVRREFSKLWMERIETAEYLDLDRPLPRARETLRLLRGDHRLVLVTLRHRETELLRQLENTGLKDELDAIVCPNGRPIASKADLLTKERPDGRAFVVGDSEADIALAKELDAPAICVSTGVRGRRFLEEAGADYVVDRVSSLPGLLHTLVA